MNATIKRRWVEALRSGEYKQGHDSLKKITDDGSCRHCCLGVLCEINAAETGGTWQPYGYTGLQQYQKEAHYLPVQVGYWSDFGDDTFEMTRKLASLNDGDDDNPALGFAEIADYIEANIPGDEPVESEATR